MRSLIAYTVAPALFLRRMDLSMEKGNFRSPKWSTPFKRLPKNVAGNYVGSYHVVDHSTPTTVPIRCTSVNARFLGEWLKYNQNYYFIPLFQELTWAYRSPLSVSICLSGAFELRTVVMTEHVADSLTSNHTLEVEPAGHCCHIFAIKSTKTSLVRKKIKSLICRTGRERDRNTAIAITWIGRHSCVSFAVVIGIP